MSDSTRGGGMVRVGPLLVPEHVMTNKEHFLAMFHTGFSFQEMVETMGESFTERDIKSVILWASKEDHENAKVRVRHILKEMVETVGISSFTQRDVKNVIAGVGNRKS